MQVRKLFGWGLGCLVVVGLWVRPGLADESAATGASPGAIGGSTGAVAQGVATTNAQDFSQGFRAFIRLGLPDVSKAKYVKLTAYGQINGMMSRMHGMYEVQLSGGGWLISENKEAKSVLITPAGRRLELFDQMTHMKRLEAIARSNALAQAASGEGGTTKTARVSMQVSGPGDMEVSGTWSETDLGRDLAKATAFIDKKLKVRATNAREARYDSFMQQEGALGTLFLLATFAWQNGKVAEANALAGSLFSLAGDSRRVIVDAMNVVADDQLDEAGDAFARSGDWKAYHAAVAALLKKYPTGWRKGGAVKLLADRLQARATLTTPPPLTGEAITDEDRKLADALATETNALGRMSAGWWRGSLWILPAPTGIRGMAMRGMKDTTALGRITERGVKSIPLLIALASDETLCPMRRSAAGMSTSYYSYSGRSGESSEERDLQVYNQTLDRPVTRGEVARSLLTEICPRDERENRGEEREAAELVEAAGKVYAALKAIPAEALPRHFLEKGDMQQKQVALGYMLEGDVETNAPLIEAFLLTPPAEDEENSWMSYGNGFAQQYVQKRGEKAAAFVEKYVAMRKRAKLPDGMADDPKYVKQMEKQLEREVKQLEAMVKKQDLAETVSDLSKADTKGGSAMAAYAKIARQKPAVALPVLLDGAVKATNTQMRLQLVQMMSMLRYSGMGQAMEEAGDGMDVSDPETAMKAFAEKNKLEIGTNAAAWKVLLADTRPMPNQGMYGASEMASWTMGDMVASAIESLYGDMSKMQEQWMAGSAFPDMMRKVLRARAEARLAGKTEEQLPVFPSPDNVTPERRKAIEADLAKVGADGVLAFIEKLTDAEKMYLAGEADENEAIMKRLTPVMRRIVEVKVDAGFPADEAARLRKLEGTTVTTNALTTMREVCQRQLGAGKPSILTLSSAGLGQGLKLTLIVPDAAMMRMYGGYSYRSIGRGSVRKGMVSGIVQNGEISGNGVWMVDLPVVSNTVSTGTVATVSARSTEEEDDSDQIDSGEDYMDSMREGLETAMATFCKPDERILATASVMFIGIMPPEKPASKDGDDDEEDEDMDFGESFF